jgi:hypothetical protein
VAWRGVAWRGVAWRGVAWRGVGHLVHLGENRNAQKYSVDNPEENNGSEDKNLSRRIILNEF